MKSFVKVALVTTFAVSAMASSDAASVSIPEFRTFNKPLNIGMASEHTMKAYEKDVINYVSDMDKVIKDLVEKRNSVIRDYNKGVKEYNSDDFFHRGSKLKPLAIHEHHHRAPMVTKEKKREHSQTLRTSTTNTWSDGNTDSHTTVTHLDPNSTRMSTHTHSSSVSTSNSKWDEKTKKRSSSMKVKYPKHASDALSLFVKEHQDNSRYDNDYTPEEEALGILLNAFLKK